MIFYPDPVISSASEGRTGSGIPKWQESFRKIKNLYLIKSVRKRNRAKRKCHTSFLDLDFLKLKLVLINSNLNSALEIKFICTN